MPGKLLNSNDALIEWMEEVNSHIKKLENKIKDLEEEIKYVERSVGIKD